MKNIFIWIGVIFIIASTVISQFTTVPLVSWLELAGFAIGLAACIVGIFTKAEKKDWKLYVAIAGTIIGCVLLVFGGLVKDQIITIISTIAGLVALILSIRPTVIKKADTKKKSKV